MEPNLTQLLVPHDPTGASGGFVAAIPVILNKGTGPSGNDYVWGSVTASFLGGSGSSSSGGTGGTGGSGPSGPAGQVLNTLGLIQSGSTGGRGPVLLVTGSATRTVLIGLTAQSILIDADSLFFVPSACNWACAAQIDAHQYSSV